MVIVIMDENEEVDEDMLNQMSDEEDNVSIGDVSNDSFGNDIDEDDDRISLNGLEEIDEIEENKTNSMYVEGGSNIEKYSDASDNEYDSDDNYEKFDEESKQTYILNKHPELIQKNYNEIEVLTRIQRNNENMIVDDNHQTIPILTKYEKTRVLGMRIKQLNNGAEPYVKVGKNVIDNYVIALEELNQKKLPFIIARPLSKDKIEYWDVNDLEMLY